MNPNTTLDSHWYLSASVCQCKIHQSLEFSEMACVETPGTGYLATALCIL